MQQRPTNAFLRSLNTAAYERLRPMLAPIELALGERVLERGVGAKWVVFPEASLLSLISRDPGGLSLETAIVGNEGAAGVMEACGSGLSSLDCIVQVDGRALRLAAADCRTLSLTIADFQARAWILLEFQMSESRQSGLCQVAHSVEQRFARWLLESFDRSQGRNPLPFTQEFLAAMLGVQRTTVSGYAMEFQRQRLIDYSRGKITLLDFDELARRACECRNISQDQRTRLNLAPISGREG